MGIGAIPITSIAGYSTWHAIPIICVVEYAYSQHMFRGIHRHGSGVLLHILRMDIKGVALNTMPWIMGSRYHICGEGNTP